MNKEVKNKLIQIVLSAISFIIAVIIERNMNLPMWENLLVFLVPYLIAGYDVLKEAVESILEGEFLGEDFLMTIATVGALAIGFLPNTESQFAEAVFVMLFFKIGELFEEIAEEKSEKAISELMNIRPDYANIEKNGKLKKVKPESIEVGDIIVVKPGERIPLDGIIKDGKSSLNTVALTGESIPRDVNEGDTANSGCINLSSLIKIKVTKIFEESTASKIIDLVENAAENKSQSEKFITKFSKYYTPVVVVTALVLAFIPPIILGNFSIWLTRALTFLVVSCPCALVISVPLTFFGGIGCASKKGILIKGANYIEKLSKVKTVVFDKTGTLTEGVFEVTAVHPEIYDENKLLHLAAHVERYSTHPIALSLKEAYEHEDDDCSVSEIKEYSGNGIKAKVNEDIVYVGNSKMMNEIGIKWKKCKHSGTIVHVAINDEYLGHIVISDRIKEEATETVREIRKNKIGTIMLTGDQENVAKAVAEKIGIDKYYSELLPQDKVSKLEEVISTNKEYTAFVGDGINDAPVLARSDIGIGMGGIGSDAAIEAANVVIMDDKVSKICKAIEISRRTLMIAKENIVFAIGIKILVLILASLGLATMWMAVFADVGVTVIAVINAMRTLYK
ncbi:MAG: cadmium-translocating P-type ATPase [Clostridia bacterium]|nr:cadmium-translocating P-type ATPase [Clostridia bacterium]